MSDAGWQADPDGRHEYRYWDGTSWTDQVSDGGVVSTDPPGPAPVPPYAAAPVPEAAPEGRKAPVVLLAVVGVVVAALVAGLVLLLSGGDDGGDDEATVATDDVSEDLTDDASDELTDDASDDATDLFTDDFTDDATSDFTDDFTDDFSDDPVDPDDPVSANALQIGDCVEDEATLTSSQVDPIPCSQPHVFELIGRFDVAGQQYPGDAELSRQGEERCTGQIFEDYVGIDYASSVTYVSSLPPSRETWEQAGDRTVLCFGTNEDQTPTTGSVQGSGR